MPAPAADFREGQGAAMNATSTGDALSILVVDDESMIAMLLEDMLLDLGCTLAGSAGSVAQSLAIIEAAKRSLDGAFLDINLRGELVYPVADALTARGVPFVFVTGNTAHGIDIRYAAVPVLSKPFPAVAIEHALRRFAEQRRVAASV
jgi:CheY-like chemotaxis protein